MEKEDLYFRLESRMERDLKFLIVQKKGFNDFDMVNSGSYFILPERIDFKEKGRGDEYFNDK